MRRVAPIALLPLAILAVIAPEVLAEVLAQAGGGSSGFSGGGGGGGGGGGFSEGGGGSSEGGGGSSDGSDSSSPFEILVFVLIVVVVFAGPVLRRYYRAWKERRVPYAERAERRARDARVSTASAEAAEEDPIFAAEAVKAQAATLYVAIQEAWSDQDEAALEPMLGRDLLVEWSLRLGDFKRKGWTNNVEIVSGPEVEYVPLVNREGIDEDRVTVIVSAKLRSVVRTSSGQIITRDVDHDADGVIDVCEYWTLARDGDRWRLVSIQQRREGAHHLIAEIVTAPWSDNSHCRTSRSSSSRRPTPRRPARTPPS